MFSFAAINWWATIRLASTPERRAVGVRTAASSSLCVYVWLPSMSVVTGHAEGCFLQKPGPTGQIPPGMVVVEELVVVVDVDVVVGLVVLVVVVVGWVVVVEDEVV